MRAGACWTKKIVGCAGNQLSDSSAVRAALSCKIIGAARRSLLVDDQLTTSLLAFASFNAGLRLQAIDAGQPRLPLSPLIQAATAELDVILSVLKTTGKVALTT